MATDEQQRVFKRLDYSICGLAWGFRGDGRPRAAE